MKQVRIVVKEAFKDLQGGNHLYKAGDNFPVKGVTSVERIQELNSEFNKQGKQLVEVVVEDVDYSELVGEDQETEKTTTTAKKTTRKKVADPDAGTGD